MKKQILIWLGMILLIGIVAGITIGNILTNLDLSREDVNTIKEKARIDKIDVELSDAVCNGEVCKFKAFQSGVINSEFIINQYWTNCILFNEDLMDCEKDEKVYYTDLEIRQKADDYIKTRLEGWANATRQREIDEEVKEIGGDVGVSS